MHCELRDCEGDYGGQADYAYVEVVVEEDHSRHCYHADKAQGHWLGQHACTLICDLVEDTLVAEYQVKAHGKYQ